MSICDVEKAGSSWARCDASDVEAQKETVGRTGPANKIPSTAAHSADCDDGPEAGNAGNVVEERPVGQWNKIYIRNHLLDFIREGERRS
jgi:hypothetical protein